MRLIDADKLILHLNDFMLQQSPVDAQDIESINVCAVIQECIKAVEEQPTAYDVDKVIEQLEEMAIPVLDEDEHIIPESNIHENYEIKMVSLSSAIEIVKGGGMND